MSTVVEEHSSSSTSLNESISIPSLYSHSFTSSNRTLHDFSVDHQLSLKVVNEIYKDSYSFVTVGDSNFVNLLNWYAGTYNVTDLSFSAWDWFLKSVPASRLVGIEPNPGPPKLLAALAGGAAVDVINKVANAIAKTKKKKKSRNRKTTSSSSNSVTKSTAVSAPVARSNIVRSMPTRSHRVPFNCLNVLLRTDGSNNLQFTNFDYTLSTRSLDLSLQFPFSTRTQYPLFGDEIDALQTVYAKWRLVSLTIEFISSSATNTPGLIAFGYDPDMWTANTVMRPIGSIASMSENIRGPTYQTGLNPLSLTVRNLDPNSKFVRSAENTMADARLTSFGNIYCSGLGLNANQTYGALGVRGIMEFIDLIPSVPNGSSTGEAVPSAPSAIPSLLPLQHITGDADTSTEAAPLGTSQVLDPTPSSYTTESNTNIHVPLIGRYRYSGYWLSTTGVAGPALLASSDVTIISSSFNSIAPYDFTIIFDCTATGGRVTLTGPDSMTAGTFYGEIEYLG